MVGDEVQINLSGRGAPGTNLNDAIGQHKCSEIWAGTETISHAVEQARKKRLAYILENGAVAMFFLGSPSADATMKPAVAPEKMTVLSRQGDIATAGTIGSSGIRWELDTSAAKSTFSVGQIVLVFKEMKTK